MKIALTIILAFILAIMSDGIDNNKKKKTIYLIRHAQSEENRRLNSLKESFKAVARFSLPKSDDVSTSLKLLNIPAQIDSDVSDLGNSQIKQLAETLRQADFLTSHGIQLVAHSPLKRACQTSEGMLGCESSLNTKPDQVRRVVELDLLTEKSPYEWIPGNGEALRQRIKDLEIWLMEQPEETICLVGHSQFFKNMLQLNFLFGNCDVWRVMLFDSDIEEDDEKDEEYKVGKGWSGLKKLYSYRKPESNHPNANTAVGEL